MALLSQHLVTMVPAYHSPFLISIFSSFPQLSRSRVLLRPSTLTVAYSLLFFVLPIVSAHPVLGALSPKPVAEQSLRKLPATSPYCGLVVSVLLRRLRR